MDVQMPAMDGYETARLIRLRRECEHTPIIFITADSDDGSEVPIAYASGAVDFMVGTIIPGVLRAKVSIFVELYLKSSSSNGLLGEVTFLSEQFRDSEAHFRAVLHNVGDGIVTLSDDGLVETFNRAAARLFGYTEEEAIGRPFAGMIEPTGTPAKPARWPARDGHSQGRLELPGRAEPAAMCSSARARCTSSVCATSPSVRPTSTRCATRRCTTR